MQAIAVKILGYLAVAAVLIGLGVYGGIRWDQPKIDAANLLAQQEKTALASQQAADAQEVAAANAKAAQDQAADQALYDGLEAKLLAAEQASSANGGAIQQSIAAAAAAAGGDAKQAPVTDSTYDQLRPILQGMQN
jgi:hypothetical protein